MTKAGSGTDLPLVLPLLVALALHWVLVAFIVYGFVWSKNDFGPQTIYSVTLEGGSSIGGISQIPNDKTPTPLAPPKNTSSTPPEEPPQPDKVKPQEQTEKPVEDKDAEVSLAGLVKTPAATPVAKPQPKKDNSKTQTEKDKDLKKTKPTPATDVNKDYQNVMQRYLGESTDAGGKSFGAAKLGGKGMGGGKLKPPEFFEYYDKLKAHVKKEWRWYDSASNYACKVAFEMDRDGTLRNVLIAQSSGSREFDDSVLRALAKANPVPAPPEIVYDDFKSVRMLFDPRE